MRYRGFVAIVAAVALTLTAVVSVDAGGKRTYAFDTGITSNTDCNVMMTFNWSNYPPKQLYTARVGVAYDGVPIPSLQWSEADQGGTDAFMTWNFAFSGAPLAETHYVTFTYSLVNQAAKAKTMIVGQVSIPTHCPSTLD